MFIIDQKKKQSNPERKENGLYMTKAQQLVWKLQSETALNYQLNMII